MADRDVEGKAFPQFLANVLRVVLIKLSEFVGKLWLSVIIARSLVLCTTHD